MNYSYYVSWPGYYIIGKQNLSTWSKWEKGKNDIEGAGFFTHAKMKKGPRDSKSVSWQAIYAAKYKEFFTCCNCNTIIFISS